MIQTIYSENRCVVRKAMNQTGTVAAPHVCLTNQNGFIQPSASLQAIFYLHCCQLSDFK